MAYDVAIIGAGFVGSSLADYLNDRYSVTTFDVNPTPPLLQTVKNVEHRVCDITDYQEIKRKIGEPKVIVHTAIVQIPAINEMSDRAYQVNVLGTHNISEIVKETSSVSGFILCGTWHVFGEREYETTVDVGFGYRPDKVEERARLYVISKMIQEGIVRFYDRMVEDKTYGVIRLGTVLGKGMPEKTAANIFVTNGLQGKPITPYKHTMHRPMLYVAIDDVCEIFRLLIDNFTQRDKGDEASNDHIFNLFYHEPITVLELAETVKEAIILHTKGIVVPKLEIVDTGLPSLFDEDEKRTLSVDISDTLDFFGINELKSPKETISEIVRKRSQRMNLGQSDESRVRESL